MNQGTLLPRGPYGAVLTDEKWPTGLGFVCVFSYHRASVYYGKILFSVLCTFGCWVFWVKIHFQNELLYFKWNSKSKPGSLPNNF